MVRRRAQLVVRRGFTVTVAARAWLAGAIACVGASGCLPMSEAHDVLAYQPLVARGASSADTAMTAARHVVLGLGATHIEALPGTGRLTALLNETSSTRDRLMIDVNRQGEVIVAVRTEIVGSLGVWVKSDFVCGSYSYARERMVAERIVMFASGLDTLTAQR